MNILCFCIYTLNIDEWIGYSIFNALTVSLMITLLGPVDTHYCTINNNKYQLFFIHYHYILEIDKYIMVRL